MAEEVEIDEYNEYENSLVYREAIGQLALPWGPKHYRK